MEIQVPPEKVKMLRSPQKMEINEEMESSDEDKPRRKRLYSSDDSRSSRSPKSSLKSKNE